MKPFQIFLVKGIFFLSAAAQNILTEILIGYIKMMIILNIATWEVFNGWGLCWKNWIC